MRNKIEYEVSQKSELERKTSDMERKLIELTNISRQVPEYENKMAMLAQEVERLDITLKSKVKELQDKDKRLNDLDFEAESNRRKMGSLESRAAEANQLSEKLFAYEGKISKMNYAI